MAPPQEFTLGCPRPVSLPNDSLTQIQVETLWIKDRSNLLRCSEIHAALVDFYVKRDKGISEQ